ncbi:hypothetical protein Rmf_43930 [Roseomonas fluvialis]|uniref:Uncharacterized protein n=1 Tax=Roseomonas fluvialis TaxID=1750527 RepID=A0ABN6PA08_9PROT|nr:hypothetical protein Rmf_43930 [Roseomonas fluvialis]
MALCADGVSANLSRLLGSSPSSVANEGVMTSDANLRGARALATMVSQEDPMFRTLTVPIRVKTPHGWHFARFAMPPRHAGEPWWVVYRDEGGAWFTTMLPNAR